MKKILLLLVLIFSSIFAQNNFSPLFTKIKSISGNLALIDGQSDIATGVSGVVIREFDKEHETIIAQATVVKNNQGEITLQLSKFDDLQQDVLPTYKIPPKIGDKVMLNYHYNRAMIIAPSKENYDEIQKNYSNFNWVHPDIFATFLSSKFKADPTRENFQDECREDSIGLLIFAIKDKAYVVDCKTFTPIQSSPITPSKSIKTPFYTRIKEVKGRMMGLFGGSSVKDYNSYYTKLLGGR